MNLISTTEVRPAVRLALLTGIVAAIAPWFTGGSEPVAQLVALGMLLLGSLLAWRQSGLPVIGWGLLAAATSLWVGFGAMSLLWTVNRYLTVNWLLMIMGVVAAFLLSYRLSQLSGGRRLITRSYLALAVVFCLYGIYLYLFGEYERLTSSIYWANPAAAYLLPGIFLAWDRASRPGKKLWFLPLALLLLATFWLTDSRGATLVLALVALPFLFLRRGNLRYWIHFLLIGLVSYGLSLIMTTIRINVTQNQSVVIVTAPGSRLAEAIKGESSSGSDRIEFIESAVMIWQDNPLLGSGAGTYEAVHPQYQGRVVSASADAHNWFVQSLSEIGAIGLSLLLAVLLFVSVGVWRGVKEQPHLLPWAAGFAAMILHLGLDIDARFPAIMALIGVWAGLVWRSNKGLRLGSPTAIIPVALTIAVILAAALNTSHLNSLKGEAAQFDGDYKLAAELFNEAHSTLANDPDTISAEGINLLTLAKTGQDKRLNLALALDRAREAQGQDPADAQHYQLEGRVLLAQDNLEGAEQAFVRALVLDPYNHPEYALDLASLLSQQERYIEALAVTRSMTAQYPPEVVANRHTDPEIAENLTFLFLREANLEMKLGYKDAAAGSEKRAQELFRQTLQR